MRAAVYSRVSTDGQERDGTSLDTQERACTDYAASKSWTVVDSVRDTASGFTLDRPGIDRVRLLLRQGSADVVVSYAVDRLSRNQNHIGVLFDEIERAGAKLEFVTERFEDTAVGRFILNVRAFIAEVEREKIAERTMRGKIERARSGRMPQATGKGCYGYTYDRDSGRRHICSEQAKIVRCIFTDFIAGKPIVAIADSLNRQGVPAFSGGRWHSPTIFKVLKNPAYSGRTIFRRTLAKNVRDHRTGRRTRKVELRDVADWIEVPGATPAIVDAPTFQKAQAILDDPERRRMGRRIHAYALSGRVKCRVCGKAIVGQTIAQTFRYYRCRRAYAGPHQDRCPSPYIQADALEAAVRRKVAQVLAEPSRILAEYQCLASAQAPEVDNEGIQREIAALDSQKARLVRLYQMGEIDDAYLQQESKALKSRRALLEGKLTESKPIAALPSLEDLQGACERIRAWVQQAGADDFALMLEGLQVSIQAERDCSHADVCSVVRGRLHGSRAVGCQA